MAALERPDPEMGEPDGQGGAIVAGPADVAGQGGEGLRREPVHPAHSRTPITMDCSWSIRAPVMGWEASPSRNRARRATSSAWSSRPEGAARVGPVEPGLALAERDGLHVPLGRGVGPAHVDAVHPDPVEAMGEGRVLGQQGERRLGRGIDRELRRAPVHVDGQDVDDGARRLALAQVIDHALHQPERRLGVDGVEPVPQVGRGTGDRAPVGEARRIDERVDPAGSAPAWPRGSGRAPGPPRDRPR